MDIDVVFEGSPLAQHMAACGIDDDFEKTSHQSDKEAESWLSGIWSRILSLGSIWRNRPVTAYFRAQAMDAIIESTVLDKDELEYCISKCADSKFDISQGIPLSRMDIFKLGLRDTAICVVPCLSIWTRQIRASAKYSLMCIPPAILIYHWKSLYFSFIKYHSLCRFLWHVKEFQRKLKNAVTFISDSDLVTRGYLMTKKSSLVWNMETKDILELSKRSQSYLPGLRLAVLQTSMRLAVAYSNATEKQKRFYPLPYNLDHDAMYLPEFGSEEAKILEKHHATESDLPSLRQLKASLDVMKLKQSECLKRMTYNILYNVENGSLELFVDPMVVSEIRSCTQEIVIAHTLHKCAAKLNCAEAQSGVQKGDSGNQLNDLQHFCRSYYTHLRHAVISSECIDKYIVESPSEPLKEFDEVEDGLKKVLHHIKSSEICLNKALLLLNQLKPTHPTFGSGIIISKMCEKYDDGLVENLVSATVGNVIPQDEVFELLVRGDEEEQAMFDDMEVDSLEIGKETSIMMDELKSVLKTRADDWEERERVARRRDMLDEVIPDVKNTSEMLNESAKIGTEVNKSCVESQREIPLSKDEDSGSAHGEAIAGEISKSLPALNLSELTQGFNLGNLAAEAVARAHSSGLPVSEESYEFLGDEGSEFY